MATGLGEKRKRAAHLGPARRRPQVLDAALGVFLERGYQGTSMQAIAAAAGVTKPVVYACFDSKDELFRALLAREEERILAELEAAFSESDLADPESTLTEGLIAFLRTVAASPDVYRIIFLGEGGGNAAIAKRIQRGRESQIETLSALARGWLLSRPSGKRPSGAELDKTAYLLGASIAGLAEAGARLLLRDPRNWSPESLGRSLGRLASRGQSGL